MYINPTTLSNQSTKAPGLIELTPEQEALYIQYFGFIRVLSTDPVEIEADTEALEKWKKEQETIVPEKDTTSAAQLRADIDYLSVMLGVELL